MEGSKLLDKLERVLENRGWERDEDGSWIRPEDHPGQSASARRVQGDTAALVERILSTRWYGFDVRDDLRTVVYATLVERGWHVDGLYVQDGDGKRRQAAQALKDALEAGF